MQILTSCPVVRDEVTKLWMEVQVPGKRELFAFERRILWIRESSTKLVLQHRGAHVDDVVTFNDFYGFLTSLDHDPSEYFKRFKILPGDALQLVATTTITDSPHLPDESDDALRWNADANRKKYLAIDRDKWWLTSNVSAGENCFVEPWYPRLGAIEVARLENVVLAPKLPANVKKWIQEQRAAAGC
jgi:hypothetical protein